MLRCLLSLGKIYDCQRENPLAIGYLSESSRDILMSLGEIIYGTRVSR